MTEHNHDEIARRLRETGTVPAPDQLRDDVMSHVRAEPRLRPSRRRFVAPMLRYAAAAAVIVAFGFAFSHLGGGGSSSSSAGAGASGGGNLSRAPETHAASPATDAQGIQARFSIARNDALKLAALPNVKATRSANGIVIAVPSSLYADYKAKLRRIEQRTPEGPTIRVILRRVP